MLGRRHTHPKAGRKELHLRGIKMKRLRLEHMFIQTLLKMSTTHLHRLSLAILHRWSKKHNVELHNKSAKNLISALLEKQWKLTKERKNQLYPQWNFGYSFVGDSFCIFKFYFVVWSASHSCVFYFVLLRVSQASLEHVILLHYLRVRGSQACASMQALCSSGDQARAVCPWGNAVPTEWLPQPDSLLTWVLVIYPCFVIQSIIHNSFVKRPNMILLCVYATLDLSVY